MRVAIYARVSLDENSDSKRFQDPMNQVDPLQKWAELMKWEVVDTYIDKGSGANPARSEWRRLMKDAMMIKFHAILVWKLDRFSREGISQVFAYIKKLKDRGVAIKSQTESWLDTSKDNPMAELTLAVMAWAADWERRKISERTKAGIQRRKNLGVYKGGRSPICRKCKRPLRSKKRNVLTCTCYEPWLKSSVKTWQKKGGSGNIKRNFKGEE